MMDFIMAPTIVGIICAGIYGLFELFVRKKERLTIIEKMADKLDPSHLDGKIGLPTFKPRFTFGALKAGALLAGIGLGLLVGFFIFGFTHNEFNHMEHWQMREITSVIFGSSVLLFGGLGLLIAFVIEMNITKKNKGD
ncbi:hypothetical protein LJC35_05060 [Parabacteroides sp. OttesenSCG-928-N08]|nr:hypothetical protein [Parabacteroides sp. OttesenSCG-928-N08]